MGGRHPPDFVEEWSRVIRIGLKPTVCPYILNPNAYSAHKRGARGAEGGSGPKASGRDM